MDINLKRVADKAVQEIGQQAKSRGFRAAKELRNAALFVLRGKRSGRVYKRPFSNARYTASAPGEPPAARTNTLRRSWRPFIAAEKTGGRLAVHAAVRTDVKYAPWLQDGNRRIKPRPYEGAVMERARPKVDAIFQEPYLK